MSIWFIIAIISKTLTFNSYAVYDGHIIDIHNKSWFSWSHESWYPFSRSYWESYASHNNLTKKDKQKLYLLGWNDLIVDERVGW